MSMNLFTSTGIVSECVLLRIVKLYLVIHMLSKRVFSYRAYATNLEVGVPRLAKIRWQGFSPFTTALKLFALKKVGGMVPLPPPPPPGGVGPV